MQENIIILAPVLKETIWGGKKLNEYGYDLPSDHVGEAWAISAHPNGDCVIQNGEYQGKKLSWLWQHHKELFGNCSKEQFPLLTKIIDANDDLSIQVHPDDVYAKVNEGGSLGKTECWYVLDAKEDATIVIGHNAKTKDELVQMIDKGRWSEFIREIPVKSGDFFQIEPGTLHAIKGGTLILETQQNSDITYRVYDYDRLSDGKPRELHLKQSKDVIAVPYLNQQKQSEYDICNSEVDFSVNKNVHDDTGIKNDEELSVTDCQQLLVACKYYRVYKWNVSGTYTLQNNAQFLLVSICEGAGEVNGIKVSKGCNFIVPATVKELSVSGDMMWMISTVSD